MGSSESKEIHAMQKMLKILETPDVLIHLFIFLQQIELENNWLAEEPDYDSLIELCLRLLKDMSFKNQEIQKAIKEKLNFERYLNPKQGKLEPKIRIHRFVETNLPSVHETLHN